MDSKEGVAGLRGHNETVKEATRKQSIFVLLFVFAFLGVGPPGENKATSSCLAHPLVGFILFDQFESISH